MEWDEIRAGQQNRSAGQMSKSDGSRLGKGGGAKWTFPSLVPFGFRVGYHHWVLQPILIGEASIHQAPLLLSVESRECLRVGNPVSAWDQTLKPRLNFLSLDLTHFPSAPKWHHGPGSCSSRTLLLPTKLTSFISVSPFLASSAKSAFSEYPNQSQV